MLLLFLHYIEKSVLFRTMKEEQQLTTTTATTAITTKEYTCDNESYIRICSRMVSFTNHITNRCNNHIDPNYIFNCMVKADGHIMGIWMMLWKEKSFYRGLQAYYILCFKPALQYSIYEQIKSVILQMKKEEDERIMG